MIPRATPRIDPRLKRRLARQLALFVSALRFLTRLPVGDLCPDEDRERDRLARALRYFGLAGALTGGLSAVVWWIASTHLPAAAAAGLAVMTGVLVSGALHEDGLADTADALGAGADRDRALEIMRDSRTGTYGTVAVALSLGLRWAALAALAPATGGLALIAAGATGRALIVPATRITGCARPDGLGGRVADGARRAEIALALGTAAAFCLFLGVQGLWALAVAGLAVWPILRVQLRRLGGYTGDGLGAIAHVGETAALIAFAGLFA